jgi:cell division protein FtsN
MGRLVRIVIYALIILILYFWVSMIMNAYYKNKEQEAPEVVTTDTLPIADTTMQYTEGGNEVADGTIISNEDIVDGKIDYKDVDSKVEEMVEKKNATPSPTKKETKPVSTTKPATKPQKSESVKEVTKNTSNAPKGFAGDGGKYMVMAGSYLLKENAQKMVTKLKAMGYTQANIVVFSTSQYHSVIAARYSSETQARTTATDLKQKGIDSFVKVK